MYAIAVPENRTQANLVPFKWHKNRFLATHPFFRQPKDFNKDSVAICYILPKVLQ